MLPDDVYPESGSRLPLPERAALDVEGQRRYDFLARTVVSGLPMLKGPAGTWLHSPEYAKRVRVLSDYLRAESGLTERVRELAILTTAREFDSQFIWAAHEPMALAQGVPASTIEIIRHRRPIGGIEPADAVVIELGRAIYGARRVASELYGRALRQFGERGLVDLAALMGHYASTTALLVTFDQQIEPGMTPLLPVP